jgi:hypothetical protein
MSTESNVFHVLDTGDLNYVGLISPTTQTSSVTYTLPSAPSSSGLALTSTTGGVMSWVSGITGSQGATGSQGTTGSQGSTGPTGTLPVGLGSFQYLSGNNNIFYTSTYRYIVGNTFQGSNSQYTTISSAIWYFKRISCSHFCDSRHIY